MRAFADKANLIKISFLAMVVVLIVGIPPLSRQPQSIHVGLRNLAIAVKERILGQRGEYSGETQEVTTPKASIFKPLLEPLYAFPVSLYTQNKEINVELTKVGVETGGVLETPANWKSGGWYKKSSKPGQNGNIIINGHYDTNTGAPAAFWELKSLKINDKVYIVDELGKVYTYKVVDSFYIGIQDPDRLRIFESPTDRYEMTLITCGGVWQPLEGYNKRLVIKAELVS